MKLSLGFSPCPNDTFIFDALVNGKVDTGGLEFDVILEDVETLNQWALQGKLDITKLSFPAFFQSSSTYILLNAGSALGKGVGPLLVKNKGAVISNMSEQLVLVPGLHTTANLLLEFAFPEARNKRPVLFSEIEDLVLSELADMGVLIHENRFTYAEKGLEKIADLGEIWEQRLQLPIPLGGIAIKRSVDPKIARQVENLVRESLQYAFRHYPEIPPYVKEHAQTMNASVMRRHIDLYVNDYSLDLGETGKQAVRKMGELFSSQNSGHAGNLAPELFFLT